MPEPPAPPDPASPTTRWQREVRERLAPLRLSPAREAEIVLELGDHLDDHWRELIAAGMTAEEAERLTLAQFRSGNLLARYMAPLRQSHIRPTPEPGAATGRLIADIRQDLHYAARTFAKQPGFTLAAVLTLALGIGANSAIFSVVRGVVLQSLPFNDADRLYRVRTVYPDGSAYGTLSAPDFMSVREANQAFDQVEAYTTGAVTLIGVGDPQEVRVASVSGGLFGLLGARVVLGRSFVTEEHTPGRNGVAILDHGFWQRAFGGDAGAITRSVSIGGIAYSIVGVLTPGARLPPDVPGARLPSEADVYLPIAYDAAFSATAANQRNSRYLGVLARARPDASPTRIDEDLRRIAAGLQARFPESNQSLAFNAISAQELIVGDVRRPLLLLLGAVSVVLVIACANVASLLLARASTRQEELTVRVALGAGRGRLFRQLLTEALALGVAGGTIGLALAYAGMQALVAAQPTDIPRLDEIRLDRTVVLFTFGISLVASLAFGTLPALQAKRELTPALRAGGRGGGTDRRAHRLRAALVVTEVALAVVLLTGAGLLLRSLIALTQVPPGFNTVGGTSFRITLYGRGYDLQMVRRRVSELESELRASPGVTGAAASTLLPLAGPGPRLTFSVEGAPPPPPDVNPEIGVVCVTPEYFRTIGGRVMIGRDFMPGDDADAPAVAIVNEAAVRRWFPDGNPIGKRVHMGGVREVVGVVADVLQGDPRRPPAPQLFVPFAQRTTRAVWIVVRGGGSTAALAASIRSTVRRIDPNLAVSQVRRFEHLQAASVARPRFYTALLALFAAVALVLAATGILGVMSYAVAERTREIGIRIVLGAPSAEVVRMFVGRALTLASIGVGIGIAAGVALGRVIENQLFGVGSFDPLTLVAVVVILLTSVAGASFFPARRASSVDPGITLRHG